MKIVSQLLNTTPNAGAKVTSAPESGNTFHGALTTAEAQSTVGVGKARISEKSQTSENKKKSATPASTVDKLQTTAQTAPQVAVQIAIPQPVKGDDSEQAATEPWNANKIPAPVSDQTGALPTTLGLVSFVAQSLGDGQAINMNHDKNVDGGSDPAVASQEVSGTAVGSLTKSIDPNSTVSKSDQSSHAPVAALPILAALQSPSANASAVKPTLHDSATSASAEPTSVPNAVDASLLATQQTAAAITQSVATPVSLPTLNAVGAVQSAPANVIGKDFTSNNAAGNTKDGVSRQMTSASKAKPGAASEARGKAADDSDAQAADASGTPSFTKILSTAEPTNHATSDFRASFDAGSVQQTPQSQIASFDGSNHMTQTPQGNSVDSRVQTASNQSHLDPQAMQGVTSAQLTQSMRSSEMKLGMQSAEFGNISISTSLNHQAISAQISIDHAELGKALAVHLPAIEEKLGSAYGVQAKVELRESNNPGSSNESAYSNSGQQSRDQRQSERGGATATQGVIFNQMANRSSFTATSVAASGSRLDIRI